MWRSPPRTNFREADLLKRYGIQIAVPAFDTRALRQAPGFALTAIMSISLAIGANSAIFSIADGLLLRPLPVPRTLSLCVG
jgi:hypothetical protein